jgi:GTP-binding protein HflX
LDSCFPGRVTTINKIFGSTTGLKSEQIRRLENLYRRRIPPDKVITPELARFLTDISFQLHRQVGIILDRRGSVQYVILGDDRKVFIPDLTRHRAGRGRFRGLRLVHTHLNEEKLSNEDYTDLALLRLDMITVLTFDAEGNPGFSYSAHLLPDNIEERQWDDLLPEKIYEAGSALDFGEFITHLEDEYQRNVPFAEVLEGEERAILVSVAVEPDYVIRESMDELQSLAETDRLLVVDKIIQRPKQINPKSLLGKGKLEMLALRTMQLGCDLIVFDQNLTPLQIRYITDMTELRVIDRTQLILDIFAKHADTRDGKLQVELAQLKYRLPRLVGSNTAMSRLMGGIGGRGPGEMKLEVDRRKVKERIHRLEGDLKKLALQREQRRQHRRKQNIPIISIIGYTNAGKSTLLNLLTNSDVYVKDQLFATLDTHSKRLRFPREREVIITDTVGFIRSLPEDLMTAFKATLEELNDADLLLHIIDRSNPRYKNQIEVVEGVVKSLGLDGIPMLKVYNKIDLLNGLRPEDFESDGVLISATKRETFGALLEAMESTIWPY